MDLRPRTAGGKREAMTELLEACDPATVVVLGDELSDVDAFERSSARPRAAGVWTG